MRPLRAIAGLVFMVALLTAGKKKGTDETQTLELPKDPPAVAVGETRRLVFHVSPLSGKGLMTQQTRDALKGIIKESGGMPVVHLRAFVAGSGDIRRVAQIVSEVFGEKKLPLPSVSVVLAGALPLDNAQVVVESIAVAKRDVNPAGLSFVSSEEATAADPSAPVRPLLDKALASLKAQDALAVTCFVTSLETGLAGDIAARFPGAAVDLVQSQRAAYSAGAECEAVARGSQVTASKLAFTGTRIAFPRLDRDLTEAGADPASIVMTHVYPLSRTTADTLKKERTSRAPMTMMPFEGVAFLDARFAVDAVAAVSR